MWLNQFTGILTKQLLMAIMQTSTFIYIRCLLSAPIKDLSLVLKLLVLSSRMTKQGSLCRRDNARITERSSAWMSSRRPRLEPCRRATFFQITSSTDLDKTCGMKSLNLETKLREEESATSIPSSQTSQPWTITL